MSIIEQTEKIEYLDFLIKNKNTGSANDLSRRLEVSKSTIHRLIEIMRYLGCPIEFSKTYNSYYYETKGGICLKFQESKLDNNDLCRISGGKNIFYKINKLFRL